RSLADRALPDAGPSGELCRPGAALQAVGPGAGAAWADSGRRESLAPGRARAGRRLARAACARELAHALLCRAEGPPRLADGTRRGGPQAGAGHSRDAAHEAW